MILKMIRIMYGADGNLYPADKNGKVTDRRPLNNDSLQAKRIQGIFTSKKMNLDNIQVGNPRR